MTDDDHIIAARCLVRENRHALIGESVSTDIKDDDAFSVLPGIDEDSVNRIVAIQQMNGGVPIRPGQARVEFRNGRAVVYGGRLVDPATLPIRNPAEAEELADVAALAANAMSVAINDVFFDADRGRFVVSYRSGRGPGSRKDIVVDETTREVLLVEDPGHGTSKPMKAFTYVNHLAPDITGPATSATEMDIVFDIPPYYSHYLRSVATGDPTSASFHANGVVSLPPLVCSNVGPATAVAVGVSAAATPWAGVTTGSSFEIATAYHWMREMNIMRKHWSSSFGYTQANITLDLTVVNCIGAGGEYYNNTTDGDLYLGSSSSSPNTSHSYENMGVIAHEYGHYVHHRYGMHGTRGIKEGWALTFPMRWMRYALEFRSPEFAGLTYNTPHDIDDLIHYSSLHNGEYRIDATTPIDEFTYPSVCDANETDPGGGHECGQVLASVFWELIWDECQLGYRDCSLGDDIIRTGTYATTARRLANNAYTWAIYNMTTGSRIEDFFDYVSDYYQDKETAGVIDSDDYNRVLSVLAHHCVGYNSTCATQFKLPDSKLPTAYTRKGPLFVQAESGIQSGTQTLSAPGTAAADNFLWIKAGSYVEYNFTIPAGQAGNYDVKFSGRYYTGASSVRVTVAGSGTTNDVNVPGSAWAWYSTATAYAFTAGQNVTVRIAQKTVQTDIDVVVLVKR